MDDSAITSDEVIDEETKPNNEETKTDPTNFNKYIYIYIYIYIYNL